MRTGWQRCKASKLGSSISRASLFFVCEILCCKLYRVTILVTDPPHANCTTDNDTHPISDIGDTMVNLVFGSIDKFKKRT